jgi:hypothetical protein
MAMSANPCQDLHYLKQPQNLMGPIPEWLLLEFLWILEYCSTAVCLDAATDAATASAQA